MPEQTAPAKKLRLAFVGAGKQAQCAHLRHYATMPECEIVAVADADIDLARHVSGRFGAARAWASHADIIEKETVDACIVTMPPIPSAERVILDLLHAGTPLFVEKPLGATVAASARIVAAAQETGTLLRVGFHKRSDPATVAAKNEIDRLRRTGDLGKLTYVRVHVSLAGDWIANGYFDAIAGSKAFTAETVPEEEFSGMNAKARETFPSFAGAHGHQFDLMRHLLGEPYEIAHVDPTGILLAVRGESGTPAVFEFTPYQSKSDWVEYAEVCFEHGYVRVELPAPLAINVAGTAEFFRDPEGAGTPEHIRPVLPHECAMRSQAHQFLEALRGSATPLCDAAQAHHSIQIAREWSIRLAE